MTVSLVSLISTNAAINVEKLKDQIIQSPRQASIDLERIANDERVNCTTIISETARHMLLRYSLSYGRPEIAAILLENASPTRTYQEYRGQALVAAVSRQDIGTAIKLLDQGPLLDHYRTEAYAWVKINDPTLAQALAIKKTEHDLSLITEEKLQEKKDGEKKS